MAVWGVPAGVCLEVPGHRGGLDQRTGEGGAVVSTDLTSLQALAERAGDELETASAVEILQWAHAQFGDGWCVASSVLAGVHVVFLDTGYHFAETMGMRDAVAAVLPVTVKTILPLKTVAEQDAEFGAKLHDRDPNLCCAMRKVEPLERALSPYRAWASGLRRADSASRVNVKVVEWDAKREKVKLNPIATWTDEQVDHYIADNGILVNPLLSDGYGSIGCAPCTRRLQPGEDLRAGRWAGTNKTECGLHV
jgi:phosphoadenosine phosphosulfate reductase